MQIYFIDNDEYFYKRNQFLDKNGEPYKDNDEKAIFFARGVLETVKNLKWKPDIILCSGWFSALVPMYVKRMYKDSVFFGDAKILTAIFSGGYKGSFRDDFADKLRFDNFTDEEIAPYGKFTYPELLQAAINYSDGVVIGEKPTLISERVLEYVKQSGKGSQLLELVSSDGEVISAYIKVNGQAVAVGSRLHKVQIEKKQSSYGPYNLINAYQVAA